MIDKYAPSVTEVRVGEMFAHKHTSEIIVIVEVADCARFRNVCILTSKGEAVTWGFDAFRSMYRKIM